ncbi:MAG: hypothetical protein LBD42_01555 [Desulfovibrio sp.]|nr:hypothetical protein [Desulfovibrio sp.]
MCRITCYIVGVCRPAPRDVYEGELGFTVKPSQTLPLSFDLGVHGYVGKREGITGSLRMQWEF